MSVSVAASGSLVWKKTFVPSAEAPPKEALKAPLAVPAVLVDRCVVTPPERS